MFLEYISRSTSGTFAYIENLLNLSRLYTGNMVPNLKIFNIGDIVANQYNINKFDAMKKRISFDVKGGTHPVFADESMVTTILHNLIRNSIKFTSNGKITISTALEGEFVCVTVSDTGIGMSKQILDNLFKLDSDTKRSGTDNEPGTGLGVILVKELVERNSGQVFVESEVGKGTSFMVTLPVGHT